MLTSIVVTCCCSTIRFPSKQSKKERAPSLHYSSSGERGLFLRSLLSPSPSSFPEPTLYNAPVHTKSCLYNLPLIYPITHTSPPHLLCFVVFAPPSVTHKMRGILMKILFLNLSQRKINNNRTPEEEGEEGEEKLPPSSPGPEGGTSTVTPSTATLPPISVRLGITIARAT